MTRTRGFAYVTCPGDCGRTYFATLNEDAPIPDPPATVHDDEGRWLSNCLRCEEELDARELLRVEGLAA